MSPICAKQNMPSHLKEVGENGMFYVCLCLYPDSVDLFTIAFRRFFASIWLWEDGRIDIN